MAALTASRFDCSARSLTVAMISPMAWLCSLKQELTLSGDGGHLGANMLHAVNGVLDSAGCPAWETVADCWALVATWLTLALARRAVCLTSSTAVALVSATAGSLSSPGGHLGGGGGDLSSGGAKHLDGFTEVEHDQPQRRHHALESVTEDILGRLGDDIQTGCPPQWPGPQSPCVTRLATMRVWKAGRTHRLSSGLISAARSPEAIAWATFAMRC